MREGVSYVSSHETAVSDSIGSKNCGEAKIQGQSSSDEELPKTKSESVCGKKLE